jgi:hypothetical protein
VGEGVEPLARAESDAGVVLSAGEVGALATVSVGRADSDAVVVSATRTVSDWWTVSVTRTVSGTRTVSDMRTVSET